MVYLVAAGVVLAVLAGWVWWFIRASIAAMARLAAAQRHDGGLDPSGTAALERQLSGSDHTLIDEDFI